MLHPSRAHHLDYLVERLGGIVPVAIDRGLGVWDTRRRAMLAGLELGAAWHLVVQDDAILCAGFVDRVADYLEHLEPCAVSLYFGRRQAFAEIAERGLESGSIVLPRLHWGLAVALPTSLLAEAVAFCDRLEDVPQDDARLSTFLRLHSIPVRYPIPSLVDHRAGESLVGDPGTGRHAAYFAGEESSS